MPIYSVTNCHKPYTAKNIDELIDIHILSLLINISEELSSRNHHILYLHFCFVTQLHLLS